MLSAKHGFLRILIVAILWGGWAFPIQAQRANPQDYTCAQSLTLMHASYAGKEFDVLKVDPNKLSTLNFSTDFGADQVFLGIEEPHHYFLMVGKMKFDAGILIMPYIRESDRPLFNSSVLLHFKNLPEATVTKLRDQMKARTQSISFSCVNGACRTLAESGIQVKNLDSPVYLAQTLEQILKEGFVDSAGKEIEYDIIQTGGKQLPNFIESLKRHDKALSRVTRMQFKDKNVADIDALPLPGPVDAETKDLILVMAKRVGIAGFIIAFYSKMNGFYFDDSFVPGDEARRKSKASDRIPAQAVIPDPKALPQESFRSERYFKFERLVY